MRANAKASSASYRGCGWWFLDETKHNARHWCSMDTCGTQRKMRRYRSTG